MGVKDLWDVLEKLRTSKSVEELRGKKLAIDLSVWLYQGHMITRLRGKPGIKPHIRNLLSRSRLLIRHDIRPLYVFDGPAPKLKQSLLERRHSQNDKDEGVKFTSPSLPAYVIEQCCELLDSLGLPYITSSGEAEMTCAQLNDLGIVDGCITEDSDVFLFGARTVYRNFSVTAGKSNSIQCYDMAEIEASPLKLTRNKMIVFALLTGCDYNTGVRDVGKERAIRLLRSWDSDVDVLQRVRDWTIPENELDKIAEYKNDKRPIHCGRCDHLGSMARHKTTGCEVCKLSTGCSEKQSSEWVSCPCIWHQRNTIYNSKSLEISIRQKACVKPEFPSEEVIEAFLHPDPISDVQLAKIVWTRPKYTELKTFLQETMYWDDMRIAKTVIPALTGWDMHELAKQRSKGEAGVPKSQPAQILKCKVRDGRKVYEVKWKSIEGMEDEQEVDLSDIVTEELATYIKEAYPELVQAYEDKMAKAALERKRKSEMYRERVMKRRMMEALRQQGIEMEIPMTEGFNLSQFNKQTVIPTSVKSHDEGQCSQSSQQTEVTTSVKSDEKDQSPQPDQKKEVSASVDSLGEDQHSQSDQSMKVTLSAEAHDGDSCSKFNQQMEVPKSAGSCDEDQGSQSNLNIRFSMSAESQNEDQSSLINQQMEVPKSAGSHDEDQYSQSNQQMEVPLSLEAHVENQSFQFSQQMDVPKGVVSHDEDQYSQSNQQIDIPLSAKTPSEDQSSRYNQQMGVPMPVESCYEDQYSQFNQQMDLSQTGDSHYQDQYAQFN